MIKFKSKNINITPEKPARLTGMGFDDRSEGIHSDLDINAMIFNQENKQLFLISFDTLFNRKSTIPNWVLKCFYLIVVVI